MKITGIAIFCLGVAIGLFALYQSMAMEPTTHAPGAAQPANPTPSGMTPFPLAYALVMTLAALVVGALLWIYGGKGTVESQNPAVQSG